VSERIRVLTITLETHCTTENAMAIVHALRIMRGVADVTIDNRPITAIHSGGDWYDASADYLVLPEGMDFEMERKQWQVWLAERYHTGLEAGTKKPPYLNLVQWLLQRGAREPTDDELVIHEI